MPEHQRPSSHGDPVPDEAAFAAQRERWRSALGADASLRERAVALQIAADEHHHTYTWSWLGVPVIRLPDDIVVLQELIWAYRPEVILETGVARGGSMVLNASLQSLAGLTPRVLGIDVQILEHTWTAIGDHPLSEGITLLELDSISEAAVAAAGSHLRAAPTALLVLDSNHTHDHVLTELRLLAPLLPVGGYVLVADTLIEEFPAGYFADRPWDRGSSPLTAVEAFLAENDDFERDSAWGRRALVTEFRDGFLRRVR